MCLINLTSFCLTGFLVEVQGWLVGDPAISGGGSVIILVTPLSHHQAELSAWSSSHKTAWSICDDQQLLTLVENSFCLKRLLGFRWKRRIGGGRARTAGEGVRMSGGNLPTSSVTSTCSHCQAGYWLLAPNSLLVASNSFPFNQFLFRRLNRPWSTSFHCQMERRSSVQNPALQHIGALYRHDVDLSEHTTQY